MFNNHKISKYKEIFLETGGRSHFPERMSWKPWDGGMGESEGEIMGDTSAV